MMCMWLVKAFVPDEWYPDTFRERAIWIATVPGSWIAVRFICFTRVSRSGFTGIYRM